MQIKKLGSVEIFLIFLGVILVIGFCLFPEFPKNNQESQKFLELLVKKFDQNSAPLKLQNITPFDWDHVCSIGADDSEPETTKEWVQKKLPNQPQPQISKDAARAMIFFRQGTPVQTLVFENTYFNLNERDYLFSAVDADGDDIGQSCFTSTAAYLNFIQVPHTGSRQSYYSITLDDEPFGTPQ